MGVAHHGERSVFGSMLVLGLGLGKSSRCRNESAADRVGRRWAGAMMPDVVREGQTNTLI
jgi:hypothetical protein